MEVQLTAHILYNGALSFEFEETKAKQTSEQKDFEKKLHSLSESGVGSALFYLGLGHADLRLSPSLEFWRNLSRQYTETLRLYPDLETHRENISIPGDADFFHKMIEQAPFSQGFEYLTISLLEKHWQEIDAHFKSAIQAHKGTVESFLHQYAPELHLVGKIYFHLVENKGDQESPFAFLATYAHEVDRRGESRHKPLKYALTEYENDQDKMLELLATVNTASQKSAFLKEMLASGEIFHPLALSVRDAHTFLNEVETYKEAGIMCRIPDWWRKKHNRPRLSVSVGDKKPSLFGMDSLLDFKANLLVGDEVLTPREAEQLLSQSEGLAFIKGKWVAVEPEQLKHTLASWKKAKKLMRDHDISLSEALRMLLSPDTLDRSGLSLDENIEVSCGEWLESLLTKMKNPELVRSVAPSARFKAKLRPYQQKGLDWLHFMHSLGFGACLADDMGLGKTIQVLAFLQKLVEKEKGSRANLLVLPASLLANWASEIEKFAPKLRTLLVHSSAEGFKEMGPKDARKAHLVVTTYGLVKRLEWVRSYDWNYVILDEAQAIKNPGTAQTRAVKKLKSSNRLVLTGTPIENRLSDLWSLFDFLNPGLLGNRSEFAAWSKAINEDTSRLRRVIQPYILRRLKTDKSVIADLPNKVELDSFADLTKKQAVLYKDLVVRLERSLEMSSGIQRRGLILATLVKFKQICNHPDQYLGQGGFKESESGKFSRLREICSTVFEKREKLLVFTQFREIIKPLDDFLSTLFGRRGLVMHGGVPVGKRKRLVEEFQSAEYVPYFILSVKTGGTGLNLTAANHVVHFDRWWNPAVENQATDRAFRIGQTKGVVVHKFVTRGTVEEKIASMIREKRALAGSIIASSGEKWLTEMSNDDLIGLFRMTS